TGRASSMEEWLSELQQAPEIMSHVTHWRTIPAKKAKTAPFPAQMHPKLQQALRSIGIDELYTHQASAFRAVQDGHHIVAVTPTASGKTFCYNLPVIQSLLENNEIRALYLFPTKA